MHRLARNKLISIKSHSSDFFYGIFPIENRILPRFHVYRECSLCWFWHWAQKANRYPFNFRQTHKSIFLSSALDSQLLIVFICYATLETIEHAFFHQFLVIFGYVLAAEESRQNGYKFSSCTHDLTLVHKSQVYRIGLMVSTTMNSKTIWICSIVATNKCRVRMESECDKTIEKICLVDFQNGKINGKMIRMLDMINIFIFTLFHCLIWPPPSSMLKLIPHAHCTYTIHMCVCPESENCFHLFS